MSHVAFFVLSQQFFCAHGQKRNYKWNTLRIQMR